MTEKKPVYNGYNEKYIIGSELKATFENKYYVTGRHHSVILGITIPEYLELINIDDTKTYRIFINDYFCRIMDAETDKLTAFFGYSSLDNIKICTDPESIKLEFTCPNCGANLKFREGKFGEFLGCSKYPSCKYTTKIPIIGNC